MFTNGGAWFSEPTRALLAHYLFIGLLRSCDVQAWWVNRHFSYTARETNLFFFPLTKTDLDLRSQIWIPHGVNV